MQRIKYINHIANEEVGCRYRVSTPHLLLRAVVCSAIRRVEVLTINIILNIILLLRTYTLLQLHYRT